MAGRIMEGLRHQALSLPDAERARLACDLVQSLEVPLDPSVSGIWDADILCQLDRVASGIARFVDRAEFARRLRARRKRVASPF